MGLVSASLKAPPLSAEAAATEHDPDARTVTFRPSGVDAATDGGRPMLFVCPNGYTDSYNEKGPMQKMADALQATVVFWEWPEHGVRRPRAAGYDGHLRYMQVSVARVKADVLLAFAETAARARVAGNVPLFLVARAYGTGPAVHVLAHAAAEDRALLKAACLLSAFTSFVDLAWVKRPTFLAWPVLWYRNSGTAATTFDNVAACANKAPFPVPVLLVHGKQDTDFPPAGAERLQMALKDNAELVMRPDWDHDVPWDVFVEGELKRWLPRCINDGKKH
jgi:pimeloyl-ACP methyl ester carboxylesterase